MPVILRKTYKNSANFSLKTGEIPYKLTNDYMFRAVFQSRPKALEGLCRSLLHLAPEDEVSVTLQNPIELGKKIDDKDFILDLAVLINNSAFLNLEMQVYHDSFWKERSISYACRSFDNLAKGENYGQVHPVIHIGFLNFTLFPEHPEFYANYMLMNTNSKNHYLYSDKFRISVIDLKQIEQATDEDKAYGIELWAKLFTATTWEEVEALAQNNEYFQETVSGVRQLTEDEKIRQQCEAREAFTYWENVRNNAHQQALNTIERQEEALQAAHDKLQAKDNELQAKDNELQAKDNELQAMRDELSRLRAELNKKS